MSYYEYIKDSKNIVKQNKQWQSLIDSEIKCKNMWKDKWNPILSDKDKDKLMVLNRNRHLL